VIAEELGFAGVLVVLALFVWLLFRTWTIGRQAARLSRPFAAWWRTASACGSGCRRSSTSASTWRAADQGPHAALLSFGGSGIVANVHRDRRSC